MTLAVLWMTILVLFRQQVPTNLLLTSTTSMAVVNIRQVPP